jgi:hypothetical protein
MCLKQYNLIECDFFLSVSKFCHNVTFFCPFYLVFFYYVKKHLCVIMMEFKIVIV